MPSTLTAAFDTRRQAEMAVEHLVQELAIERTDIFITTEGDGNSAGTEADGSDTQAAVPSAEDRDDAALAGRIVVSVDLQDDRQADAVRAAFAEFDGERQDFQS